MTRLPAGSSLTAAALTARNIVVEHMKGMVALLLLLASAPAAAEWVKYATNDLGTNLYFDPATIRVDGNLRRVWGLQDLKQRDSKGAMSRRGLEEYDCKDGRMRILSFSFHSEPMARGMIIASEDSPSKWVYIPPGAVYEHLLKHLCRK